VSAPAVLRVRGLTKWYGGLRVFEGVDLDVARGTVVGLIGPNGAGKSTLVGCVAGTVAPDAGRIEFQGRDWSRRRADLRVRDGLGRTFQHPTLIPGTVLDNVLVGAHASGRAGLAAAALRLPGSARDEGRLRARAVAALRAVRSDDLSDEPGDGLSAGRRRLVALARALAGDATLLLLDEPAAGLDETETRELAGTLRRLVDERGCTVLVIEHHMDLVMSVCDRVAVLAGGALIADDRPERVRRDPAVVAAYLGTAA
jgi:branched-chain amino acid transport system ATP-binding protein